MKEKSRRRFKRDQARRDPRARLASPQAAPVDGKSVPAQARDPQLDVTDDEHEADLGTDAMEHEESRRILGYDE
jgi:hypothetical protein